MKTGHNRRFWKEPICNNIGRQFNSVSKININETEIPLQKQSILVFAAQFFSDNFW